MRLSLLNEDLEQTIARVKAKYNSAFRQRGYSGILGYNKTIDEIAVEVPEQALEWVVKSLVSRSGIWPEDHFRFLKEFENYRKNRGNQKYVSELKKIHPEYRNILNYSLHDLEQASETINPQVQWSQKFRELPEGAELFREVPPYRMVEVTTPEAAVELAKGTKWCTSDPKVANSYLKAHQSYTYKNGQSIVEPSPLYVIFKNNQKIAQYHEGIEIQLMDLRDRPYLNAGELVSVLDLPIDKSIIKHPFDAYDYAELLNCRIAAVEKNIVHFPIIAYKYAANIIKGPWSEAEPTIMRDPEAAFNYAANILKRPWLEAEPYIKKNPKWHEKYLNWIEWFGRHN